MTRAKAARGALAIGREAGLGAVRTVETRVSDVHAAILSLATDGPRPVLVDAACLSPRPRAALRALARAARPFPVTVLAPRSGRTDVRTARAAEAYGVEVVSAAGPSPSGGDRPAPRPKRTGANPVPRADRAVKTPRKRRPEPFVDGCFRRLDRADDLCRFVLVRVARAAGAKRASLMLVDSAKRTLFLKAARGLDSSLVGRLKTPVGAGLAGRAARVGRAIVGLAGTGGSRGYAGASYAVLPLGRGADCEGVLSLTDFPRDEAPDDRAVLRLLRMASRAGRALAASRRLEVAESLSATDELTQIPNRRAFERALHREVERARRSGARLAVALLDVDHFKALNDRFGHPAGDRVLAQAARRLAGSFRETDLVARWGGEEFAVLLTEIASGADEALAAVERARRAVSERPLALGPGLPSPMVTVSGGVAIFPDDAADAAALVRRADEALYGAKNAGRDRVLPA